MYDLRVGTTKRSVKNERRGEWGNGRSVVHGSINSRRWCFRLLRRTKEGAEVIDADGEARYADGKGGGVGGG